jgi:hypothetical protein
MRCLPTLTIAIAATGLGLVTSANAATVCVNTAADLQAALLAAEGSTSATTIEVARGTYSLGGTELIFTSQTVGQGQLDISGGYEYDGGLCSSHVKDPTLTIFDGQGMNAVFNLQSSQGISVRYLTIENGDPVHDESGGLTVASSNGGLIIDYNIIRNNSAILRAAGINVQIGNASASADIHIDGNLIAGNNSQDLYGAGAVRNEGTGSIYVTNNTIVDNVSVNSQAGMAVYGSSVAGTANVSNNIFWGNSNYDLILLSAPVLVDNDYQTSIGAAGPGSSGNLHVDPLFYSSGNFHLQATSPLLGAGTLTPAGNLPTIDIEGNPRSYNGFVDMGAYERGEQIFNDGFEN